MKTSYPVLIDLTLLARKQMVTHLRLGCVKPNVTVSLNGVNFFHSDLRKYAAEVGQGVNQ